MSGHTPNYFKRPCPASSRPPGFGFRCYTAQIFNMSRRKPGAFIAVLVKERNSIIAGVKFSVILANIDITMTIWTNSVVFLRVQEPSLTHRGHVCLPAFAKKMIAATPKGKMGEV